MQAERWTHCPDAGRLDQELLPVDPVLDDKAEMEKMKR